MNTCMLYIFYFLYFTMRVYANIQCPVMYNNYNCVSNNCFCPLMYDKHLINNCYICQPKCDKFDCSLKHCYCPDQYIKTNINDCYKCIIKL